MSYLADAFIQSDLQSTEQSEHLINKGAATLINGQTLIKNTIRYEFKSKTPLTLRARKYVFLY